MLIALLTAGLPVMVAHRGGMAERPQNTIAAFEHALQVGAAMLEFDMGVTRDDEIVIHHDSIVNGRICTSQTVKPAAIRTLTLAQIRTFDCGQGQRMPTLDEVLKRFKNAKVEFLAETKMDGSVDAGHFAKLVAAKVRENGLEDRFILQSGDYDTLAGMRRAAPRVRICLVNARRFKPRYKELAAKYKAEFIMLRLDDVTDEGLAELRAMGVKIISSTANSPDQWAEYRRRGFDAILTDEPSAVMRFLAAGGRSRIGRNRRVRRVSEREDFTNPPALSHTSRVWRVVCRSLCDYRLVDPDREPAPRLGRFRRCQAWACPQSSLVTQPFRR